MNVTWIMERIELLTGWARVRLRRHPRTKITFSMVPMTTPTEKEKTPSDDGIFKTSDPKERLNNPDSNLQVLASGCGGRV